MKKYPEYKDSGIFVIGKIPRHWTLKAIKFIGQITLGKMLTTVNKNGYQVKPYLRAQNIQWEKVNLEDVKEMEFSDNEIKQYSLEENDILISEGGEVGRAAIWKKELNECYIQNSVHRIRMNQTNIPIYYLYHFYTYGKTGYFNSIVNKVSIAHLTREKLKDVKFLCPTSAEQKLISNYLMEKTSQIDSLIEKKKRLIELLKEYRTAIINNAVTKGLDPDVKMKDSGIEWIGEIPEHWDVKRLLYITKRIGDGLHGTPLYVDNSEYFFINGNNLIKGSISITNTTRCISQEEYNIYAVDLNDTTLLISINGTIGNVSYYRNEPVALGKSVAYINCSKAINRDYLFLLLQSSYVKAYFDYEITGTTISNLSLKSIRNIPIVFPSLNEQLQIVDFLKSKISILHRMDSTSQQIINILQEYRRSLISDAVTGKIDVREEVDQAGAV